MFPNRAAILMPRMIDTGLAAFLQEGLGIHLGTRDGDLRPEGARGLAVSVEDSGRQLVVFVAEIAAERLMPNLESNGQAAVTFARPVDERACQVKGTFLGVRRADAGERALIEAQWEGFMRQLELIGIPRVGTAAWTTWPAAAIRLRVTAVFDATPGPKAGAAIA